MAENSSSLVDPEWLVAHRDDPNIILIEVDADNTEAYEQGHIPGSIGWAWKDILWDSHKREFPDPEEFARRLGSYGISNDSIVIFYGDPIEFGFYGWWTFKYCGHRDVRMLDGGKKRWIAEGYALTREVSQAQQTVYRSVQRDESIRSLKDDVLAALHQSSTVILDNRSDQEFNGTSNNLPGKLDFGAERYGHIPGAKHLNYVTLLKDDDSFESADYIRGLVSGLGAAPDKEVICYCRRSHRSALVFFALTELLGYAKVRNYDGSWTEWGTAVGVPIER